MAKSHLRFQKVEFKIPYDLPRFVVFRIIISSMKTGVIIAKKLRGPSLDAALHKILKEEIKTLL